MFATVPHSTIVLMPHSLSVWSELRAVERVVANLLHHELALTRCKLVDHLQPHVPRSACANQISNSGSPGSYVFCGSTRAARLPAAGQRDLTSRAASS
jgi:GTP-sensing pleiotropic transcriptional regulator CodY